VSARSAEPHRHRPQSRSRQRREPRVIALVFRPRRKRHADHETESPAPLLVRADAHGPPGRRAEALPPSRRGHRAVEAGRRHARGRGRPLLPPHCETVEGLRAGRPSHLRVPRLAVRLHRRLRQDPPAAGPGDPGGREGARLPRPGEVRLRVGGPRRPAASHPGFPRGRRAGLPPHLPVLRGVADLAAAHDGELVRQLALLLRAQGQLRDGRQPEAGALPVPRDRLRLRGRDPGADQQPAGQPPHHRHDGPRHPPPPGQPLLPALQPPLRLHLSPRAAWPTSSTTARRRSTTTA
jgi:hypothetical protein